MKSPAVICFIFFFVYPAFAEDIKPEDDGEGIFNIVLENDMFTGQDGNYTSGIRAAWLSSEDNVMDWVQTVAEILPLSQKGKKRFSLAAGQSLFTPNDLSRRDFIAEDRPYAGWLYGSLGILSDTGKRLDNALLTLGVVGPLAYGRQSQTFTHRVIDSPRPHGWDNQLKNEPGINLAYERKWRGLYESSPFGAGADVTPHVGVTLGNVNTDVSTGLTLRLGYDLPADYGPPRIRPSLPGSDFFIPTQELGGYLFTTLEGRAVGRNIFLDGNTFRSGPHVDKEILIGSVQLGAAITYDEMRISYTHVFMTKEFKTQQTAAQFGVITFSYRF